MADDNIYNLSRRKALMGLGTIGVAGAAAGMGTSALFSDTEEFNENQITAGTLDMAVTAEVVAANDYWSNQGILGNPVTANGDVLQKFQLNDVKPGDWAIICFTVDSVGDNPFYLTIHGDADEYREKEGASSEPEKDVDNDTTDNGFENVDTTNAELGKYLHISYWEQWGGTDRSDLEYLDNIANAASNDFYGDDENNSTRGALPNGGNPDADGVVTTTDNADHPPVEYTNAREFYFGEETPYLSNPNTSNDPLGNGIASGDGVLVGGVSDPVKVGSTDSAEINRRRMSDPDNDDEAELVFYLCLEVPKEVGNVVQGDAVKGNLRFSAEQVRNNSSGQAPRSGTTDPF